MEDIVIAAQNNDLDNLRRLIDLEKAQNPALDPIRHPSTRAMQRASAAAARHNQPAALDMLLNSGCWISRDIIVAALTGKCKAIFDLLFARGWDVNSRLGHCGDALLLSVGSNDEDMVEYLISHGANPNANVGLANSRALEHATPYAPMSIIRILCDAGAKLKGRRALSNAAANGRTDVVAYLLEGGAVIDEVPENDDISDNARELGVKNALCEAAYIGQSEVVKMLLERGANVDVKDTKGKSALKLAEEGGHEACVRILKEHTGS